MLESSRMRKVFFTFSAWPISLANYYYSAGVGTKYDKVVFLLDADPYRVAHVIIEAIQHDAITTQQVWN